LAGLRALIVRDWPPGPVIVTVSLAKSIAVIVAVTVTELPMLPPGFSPGWARVISS
jgi:hypothetical protein